MKLYLTLFSLAFLIKLIFLLSFINYDPSLKFPNLDSAYYLEISSNLKKGKLIPEPEGFYLLPPGYSFFLTILPYKNGNYLIIFLIQIFLGAIATTFILKIGKQFSGKRAGILSSFLFIFYGPASFYEIRILSEAIFSFFFLLFLILFSSEKKIFQILSGIILGYLCLLRQNIILFWLFLFLWAILKERKKIFVLISSIPFFIIVPAVNYFGTGKFLGTSAQGGIAFYMGNNPSSYGLFSDPIGLKGDLHRMAEEIKAYTEMETGKKMSPVDINYYWIKKVFLWAKKNPLDFIRNIILKIQRFLDSWEYGLNEQWIWGNPKITYTFFVPFSFIIASGLAGFFAFLKLKKTAPVNLFFFSQILILLIFFPSSRHRFLLVPVLCLWAGAFLDKFFSLEKRKKIYLGGIFFLTLIFSITGVPDERRKPDPFISYNQALACLSLGKLEQANYWLEKALEGNWTVSFFHLTKAKLYDFLGKKNLAMRHKWHAFYLGESDPKIINELGRWALENKKYKAAEKVFRRSVEVYPESGAAAINLSQVLYLLGKMEEAKKWYEKGIALGGYPIKALEEKLKISK